MIRSLRPERVPWLTIQCTPASFRKASALSAIKAGLRNSQLVDQDPSRSAQSSPWQQKLGEKMKRRKQDAQSYATPVPMSHVTRGQTRPEARPAVRPAPEGDLKAKWRKGIDNMRQKLREMIQKPATYGLDVQSDNISMLKDEYRLTRDRLKALASWYEAALPPILDTGRDTVFRRSHTVDGQRALSEEQRVMWERLFDENPGILGDINREFRLKIRHLQTLLQLPAIRRAEVDPEHRWIKTAKASHLGRDPDEGTPANRTLRAAHRNNGIQRVLRTGESRSQFYRQRGVSWEELEETSLEFASDLDQGHGDLGFGSRKQDRQFDGEREERKRTRTGSAEQHGHESQRTAELEDDSYVPISYTRADSEFLYGANSVLAALKAGRRSLHKLYIDPTSQSQETRLRRDQIHQLASDAGILIDANDQSGKRQMLYKMSQGRPHNGVVLEASPLPFDPVERIMYDGATENIHLMPHQQAADRGPPAQISAARHDGWRQPFVLLLDGILDPGNMGNIIRTAHFYNLTAVAICSKTCAPVGSSVTVKSSSGAIEAIPLINVPFPASFIRNARDNDWNVFAAVAPPQPWKQATRQPSTDRVLLTTDTQNILAQKPAILMLGAEGEGLRDIMVNKATHKISIPGGGRMQNDVGVDSLNVASAAAVLIDALVKKPSSQRPENRSAERLVARDRGEPPSQRPENRGAERLVARDRGEPPKQARAVYTPRNRDTEELEDDQDLADEDEKPDYASVKDRSRLAALEQIEQIRALKKEKREKIAKLKAESRANNKTEIIRLKKENQKHHKEIQEIKKRAATRMNTHDVKLLREMIQKGASSLQAQDTRHLPPAEASSLRIRKHYSEPIGPFDTPHETTSSERPPETYEDRAGEKGNSSSGNAAEAFEDFPAELSSPRITKAWSTAKEPIYKNFKRLDELTPSEETLQRPSSGPPASETEFQQTESQQTESQQTESQQTESANMNRRQRLQHKRTQAEPSKAKTVLDRIGL
ncbi:hypothetical protein MBLNU457_4081t1 [Dothideomycetes sp. NU457]